MSLPWAFVILGILALSWAAGPLRAQLVKGFVLPEYYDQHDLEKGQTNRLRGRTTGKTARVLQPAIFLIEMPEIQRYTEQGTTNVIARSPECILDQRRRVVSSTNKLTLEAGDGQLYIEGEGYLCYLTNFNLTLSNRVWTRIRQDALQTNRKSRSLSRTNTAALASTNPPVNIFADRLQFYHESGVAIYTGNVKVENTQLDLSCEHLTIRRSTNDSIESIVAETNVLIVNKIDQSRATGDRADYRVGEGHETMTLIGTEAHWQDPLREGKARQFVFDLKNNTVEAEERAWMKVPRAVMESSAFSPVKAASTNAPLSLTNQFVEVAAEYLFIELPMTNRPSRSMLARTNVVILSPADKSRATSDYALFNESTGLMKLVGHGVWEADQRLTRGDTLFYDRTNRIFRADGNAFLRMPATSLDKPNAQTARRDKTNAVTKAAAQRFIEVTSDNYDFQDGFITFHDNVRCKLLEGETPQSALTCDWLSIQLSNRVETATARGHVFAEELPAPSTNGISVSKHLKCETLTLTFATNGLAQKIVAEQQVEARQSKTRPGQPPVHGQLNAGTVTAWFFTHTNQVREAVAEQDVVIRQNETSAKGARAFYTGTNNVVELTGNPTAEMPKGRITEAEVLLWDRTQEKFYIKKFKAQGENVPAATNRSNLPPTR